METFISERDVLVRIKNHPDFTQEEVKVMVNRYCLVEEDPNKAPRSYTSKQSKHGKKHLRSK